MAHRYQPGETALLIYIWSKHNGRNNGEIGCGRREVQQRFGCGGHTAIKWLHGLRDKGFIVATVRGSFNQKTGGGRTTRWRLTMEGKPSTREPPTREYLSWRPPADPEPVENPKRRCCHNTNITPKHRCSHDTNMASNIGVPTTPICRGALMTPVSIEEESCQGAMGQSRSLGGRGDWL